MKPLTLVHCCTQLVLQLTLQLFLGNSALAQEFVCNNGTETRKVRLEYPGRENLCEVSVTLADQSREVKWLANSTSVFCSEKIIELAGKYRSQWNYTCEEVASTTRLDGLAPEARVYLDALVSQIVQQGQTMTPGFKLVSVNAVGNHAEISPESTMVAQLSIQAIEDDVSTDRIYVVKFSPEGAAVQAIQIGLAGLLSTEELPISTAIVTDVDASGTFTVSTTVVSNSTTNGTTSGANPGGGTSGGCNGSIRLEVDDGKLSMNDGHKVVCE